MKKTTMPDWCVAVKKAMIDHDDMTVTELAKETGFSRSHISQVVNGVLVPSENVQGAIEKCLNISGVAQDPRVLQGTLGSISVQP